MPCALTGTLAGALLADLQVPVRLPLALAVVPVHCDCQWHYCSTTCTDSSAAVHCQWHTVSGTVALWQRTPSSSLLVVAGNLIRLQFVTASRISHSMVSSYARPSTATELGRAAGLAIREALDGDPAQLLALGHTQFRAGRCCSCAVVQCLCCSLRAGVLTLAAVSFVNACLAFAGEALLVFDMAGGVAALMGGGVPAPGTALGGARLHGALIAAGVFSLIAALAGFAAGCCRSLRAASLFFVMQAGNAAAAVALLAGAWAAGILSAGQVAANVPGIVLIVYLVVCVNSYRLVLREERAAGSFGHTRLPAASAGAAVFEDDDDEDDDDLPRRVGAGATAFRDAAAPAAAGSGKVSAAAAGIGGRPAAIVEGDEDDDEEGDLGVARGSRRV